MKIISFEQTGSHYKYVISSKADHSVEILYRRRPSSLGRSQADGGAIVGWSKAEEVQAFREASDWLSRFLHADGSPRRGDAVFEGLLPDLPGSRDEKAPDLV